MYQINAKAIVPVYTSHNSFQWLTTGLIRQLSRLKCNIQLSKGKPIPIKIRGLSTKEAKTVLGGSLSNFHLIEIQTVADFNPENWKLEKDDSPKARFDWFCQDIRFEFHKIMDRLVIASNIARPGSISIWSGGVFFCDGLNNLHYHEKLFCWELRSKLWELIVFEDEQPPWPKIKLLQLDKVWGWLNRVPDIEKGYGSTPLGRGLAAFTYLFSHGLPNSGGDQQFPLIWLMSIVGLESIYESNSSQRTLKERCEFFLARPKGNNSNVGDPIGELYKKRNTLVHGGMKISFKFGYDESFPEVENSWSTIYSLDAAIPFLVATLQKMAQLNIHKLEFELRLKKK